MNELRKYFSRQLFSRLTYDDANTLRIIEDGKDVYLIVFTRSLQLAVIRYRPKGRYFASRRVMLEQMDLVSMNEIDGLIFTIADMGSEEEVLDLLESMIDPKVNQTLPIHDMDGFEILAWNKAGLQSWNRYRNGETSYFTRSSKVSLPEWRISCYHISRDNTFVSGIVALFSMVAESISVQYYLEHTEPVLPDDLNQFDEIYSILSEYNDQSRMYLPTEIILEATSMLERIIAEDE
jgi:hypothetical protein